MDRFKNYASSLKDTFTCDLPIFHGLAGADQVEVASLLYNPLSLGEHGSFSRMGVALNHPF